MYDDAYEETVKSSELDETEYSRRMKKTHFVAATLPVLEGMTDRLLDPATTFARDAETILPSIDQMCLELEEIGQTLYKICYPEPRRPTDDEHMLVKYRSWLSFKIYIYIRRAITARATETDVVAAFRKLKRRINRFDKAVTHATKSDHWY